MAKIRINISSGTVQKNDDIVVGIDLGTTNSLVAYADAKGIPKILHHGKSSKLVPSIIYFDDENKPIVGAEAHRRMLLNPKRAIFSIKRLMGKSWNDVADYHDFFAYDVIDGNDDELVKIRMGDRFFTPIELSAMILKELKNIAERELNQSISKAVITVPAYFNDSQRQATKDAGKLAGLNVLRIVNEPTAASLAFGLGKTEINKTVAVYDLGGGTFDISILNLFNGVFEVVATHGDTFLGGDDFDKCIVDYWALELNKNNTTYSPTSIRILAEKAKQTLSVSDQFTADFNGIKLELSKSKFAELTSGLIQKTLVACERALADAKLTKSELDEIILVGGSTRMPIVREALTAFFEKDVNTSVHPDEAVALGAAIQADILSGRRTDMILLDVTPLSLGIETVGGLMDTILPRNSKIPAAVGRNYTTSVDGQKNLKVAIFQGERDLVEHNRKLGEFILRNIPPMAAGMPKIEIKFIIDADGILQVKASELRSGVEQHIEVKPQYGISEEDMGRMLMESITHAQTDITQRALIEARTEAQSIKLSTDRFIRQNIDWLTKDQVDEIISLNKALEIQIESDDKDAILKAMEALNEYSRPLAHEALDRNIANSLKGDSI